jgi:hypothetical protein
MTNGGTTGTIPEFKNLSTEIENSPIVDSSGVIGTKNFESLLFSDQFTGSMPTQLTNALANIVSAQNSGSWNPATNNAAICQAGGCPPGPGTVIIPSSVPQPSNRNLDYGTTSNNQNYGFGNNCPPNPPGPCAINGTQLLLDLRKGFYLTGIAGYQEGWMGAPFADPLFKVRRMTPDHNLNDYNVRAASVIEDCLGASVSGCLAGDYPKQYTQDLALGVTAYDGDPTASSADFGLNVIQATNAGNLADKRARRVIEADLANSSQGDASAWDDTLNCGTWGSDCNNTGVIAQSTGRFKAGIAFNAGSNYGAPCATWRRGARIQDWDQAGVHIRNTYSGSTGWTLVLDDSTSPATGIQLMWTRGAPNTSSNLYFNWVFGPAADLKLFNQKTGSTTPAFTLNGGGANSITSLNSFGSSPITLNVDSGSGSGVEFGDGRGSPVASVSSTGAASFTSLSVSGAKNFKIDHPLDAANKYLYRTSVESPDMKDIYDGTVITDDRGFAIVVLPNYFESLNRDFRYQLTVIGRFAQVIVAKEISHNRFTIRTNTPHVKVSWQVTGVRHDAYAEAHRSPVEVEKPAEERGHYLHPELFGASQDKAIGAH